MHRTMGLAGGVLLAVTAALTPAPARAEVSEPVAGSAAGLAPGTLAPQFTLPVLNSFAGGKKWGPGRWVGPSDGRSAQPSKKLVVLSFFATWCAPCRREMPELVRLDDIYREQGLGVMLVSIDKGDAQREEIVALAREAGVTFPVLHDRFQVVARRYAAEQLPYLLLIDEAGIIRNVHLGYTEDLKAGLENEVRAGLGLPPVAAPAPAAVPAGAVADPGGASKSSGRGKATSAKPRGEQHTPPPAGANVDTGASSR